MPYIKPTQRSKLHPLIAVAGEIHAEDAGELNYLLTRICHIYMQKHGENYQHYNDVMGALEGCKLELYRRKIVNYETAKISENGDVS